MNELVFEVIQEADGGFCAECLTENIFTQADNWDELRKNVLQAVSAFFFDDSETHSSVRPFLRLAGAIAGPRDLSTRKGFSQKLKALA